MGVDFHEGVMPEALRNDILYARVPVFDFDRIDQVPASSTASPPLGREQVPPHRGGGLRTPTMSSCFQGGRRRTGA